MENDEAGHLRVERTVSGIRTMRAVWRSQGRSIGFVPTMGYLHEGHLSLVDLARRRCDSVVVSIFVNPTQFGPTEDFADYPRDLESDLAACAARGVDLVFAPGEEEIYPRPQTIWIEPGPLAQRLCGRSRPTHFRGVLTVVAKLFAIVEPDIAVFGRKDFQQALLIRRMVEELAIPARVELGAIVREPDGLAMSSRNRYLDAREREAALALSRALRLVRAAFAEGEADAEELSCLARDTMAGAGARVDYVEIVDPYGLDPVERVSAHDLCAVAAYVGDTRLIDNSPLGDPCSLDGTGSPLTELRT